MHFNFFVILKLMKVIMMMTMTANDTKYKSVSVTNIRHLLPNFCSLIIPICEQKTFKELLRKSIFVLSRFKLNRFATALLIYSSL